MRQDIHARPILHVYPGGGLLDRPFEEAGFCIVRGPDLLHGRRMQDWRRPTPGVFGGLLGGPPCQPYSVANQGVSLHSDGVGEFWALADYLQVPWAVMEEVYTDEVLNHPGIPPDVYVTKLNDWNCGGNTMRVRGFWHRGFHIPQAPHRDGDSDYSVLARSWDNVTHRDGLHSHLSAAKACDLQGFPEFMEHISDERRVVPEKLIVHMMGNGVPRAMGEWVVRSLLNIPHPVLKGQQMGLVA